ncbi:hypothetical protein [Spirosoma areae]
MIAFHGEFDQELRYAYWHHHRMGQATDFGGTNIILSHPGGAGTSCQRKRHILPSVVGG